MEAFMGMVMPVAFNYAPRGWMFCNGQTVAISQNSAMFALLGTMYGGDGVNTFGLPDLRGRAPFGSQAQGPGLQNIAQGQMAGTNNATVVSNGSVNVTLTAANLPAHTHPAAGLTATTDISVSTGNNGVVTPANGSVLSSTASGGTAAAIYAPSATDPVTLGGVATAVGGSTGSAGSGAPLQAPVVTQAQISIMPPYLGLNYIICMQGIFPSRN